METKKLKKLVIKKDVIASLNDPNMNRVRGGYGGNDGNQYLWGTRLVCPTIKNCPTESCVAPICFPLPH